MSPSLCEGRFASFAAPPPGRSRTAPTGLGDIIRWMVLDYDLELERGVRTAAFGWLGSRVSGENSPRNDGMYRLRGDQSMPINPEYANFETRLNRWMH